MKHLKILGLGAMVAGALMAVVASSAFATKLTSPANHLVLAGTTIHMVNITTETLTTSFLNIECKESTLQGKTTNEGQNHE